MIASKKSGSNSSELASYAERATKAMRRAQKEAAKENARYGLPLIVVDSTRSKQRKKK